jgi:hypothetical protein
MRNVPLMVLTLGILLLNLAAPGQGAASAYQEVCLIQEGHVDAPGEPLDARRAGTSSRSTATPPSENCAQAVVVADVVACHRRGAGEFNCEVSFTATMSVSGLAACGDLSGAVSIQDLCPTLVTDSRSATEPKEYTLPPNGGTIRETFDLCVSIRGLTPELLGGVSQACQRFELAAFVAPNSQMSMAICADVVPCVEGLVASFTEYVDPTLSYALEEASVSTSNAISIAVGTLP